MNIIDLTPDYIRHVIHNNDFEAYEKVHPALFEHYYKYWSMRKESDAVDESKITSSRELILSVLPQMEKNFAAHGLDITSIRIILFVGQRNTNGHAFRDGNEFVIWIPVEPYTNKIDTQVFITHEIAHALHYDRTPSFYFDNASEKQNIGRQLITEGLATYMSKIVAGFSNEKALWGEYIVGQAVAEWMKMCERKTDQLKQLVKENFKATEHQLGLFYANDPDDIYNYRAGYYLGLLLVEQIAEKYQLNPNDLLSLSRTTFEQYVLELL